MRAPALWVLALLAACPVAMAASQDVVIACARVLPESSRGLAALEAQCPGLQQALEDLGVTALLALRSAQRLQASELEAALALMGSVRPSLRRSPDLKALGPILAQLRQPGPRPSWWERIKAWLLERLSDQGEQGTPAWLRAWLSKLGFAAPVLPLLTYVLLVLLVAGACLLVLGQLRPVHELLRGRAPQEPRAALATAAPGAAWSLEQLHAVPAQEQVRLLLRMLIDALVTTGRLPDDRSLTHRELASRARLDDASQRGSWMRLASVAERQLFAPKLAPDAELGPILDEGEALYSRICAAGGSAR